MHEYSSGRPDNSSMCHDVLDTSHGLIDRPKAIGSRDQIVYKKTSSMSKLCKYHDQELEHWFGHLVHFLDAVQLLHAEWPNLHGNPLGTQVNKIVHQAVH